jgi:hypothetical protein
LDDGHVELVDDSEAGNRADFFYAVSLFAGQADRIGEQPDPLDTQIGRSVAPALIASLSESSRSLGPT